MEPRKPFIKKPLRGFLLQKRSTFWKS